MVRSLWTLEVPDGKLGEFQLAPIGKGEIAT
jgi:hypothetical protein